ncbi:MAG TPA: alpha-amylase family glycosyl hydrolase [Bryobacteraceae bacterium]|nr:alpha-amylase family glycosyl hydrolase [Bryobacteraceae bacterium]
MHGQRLSEIDWSGLLQGRSFHHSPAHWEDEVLYFLMLDRFSDGKEDGYRDLSGNVVSGSTPLYKPEDNGNAVTSDQAAGEWREAGRNFVGGKIEGLRTKLGYLRRLGVTAIWITPVFRQVAFSNSYHGYGIQNFLEVDERFGTKEQLKQLVAEAHTAGIRVILDIILNHAGDIFAYDKSETHWTGELYGVKGYRDPSGAPTLPFASVDLNRDPAAWPDGALWPAEFQPSETFTRRGYIKNWDYDPEFLEGDFEGLKDIHHGIRHMVGDGPGMSKEEPGRYRPSRALSYLCDVYKFWIAYLDLDGYRVDTVKHMDLGATRYFAAVIHEFAESLGKDRFYLIGEITGGRQRAFETRRITGLDAALGIDDVQDKLEYMVKGYRNPKDYFDLFANSAEVLQAGHQWMRDIVVTQIDDHDQVRKGDSKARFCSGAAINQRLVLASLALNACTLGIPCIYYGTEQLFDGEGQGKIADRYIREAMFGHTFGAFRSKGRHFFNEDQWVYRELGKILTVRRDHAALRRGRQYLRPISGDGVNFGIPEMIGGEIRSVVPWSRLDNNQEVIVAINTDAHAARTAWVTIDNELHTAGEQLKCLYSTDPAAIGSTTAVEPRNGKSVSLTVPDAGVVIYA